MRSVLVAGALVVLSAAGASAQYYGPGYGPPPPPRYPGYGPPPPPGYGPPPRYYGGGYGPPPPPRRCWVRHGPYGPERVCRGW